MACKPCGLTVHSKCEMKVPADCGVTGRHTAPARANSTAKAAKAPSASARTSTVSAASAADSSATDAPRGTALYTFEATSPFELSIQEGETVSLVEEDLDGSGWIKVAAGGRQGLVPSSYCEFSEQGGTQELSSGVANVSLDGGAPSGSGQYVRALYDFDASDEQEMSLREGDLVQLSESGTDFAEGWTEGIRSETHHGGTPGTAGIFPSNYVEAAE